RGRMREARERRMVRFVRLGHTPIHARGELVLESAAPPEDRRIDGVVRLTVRADHFIDRVRPDRPRFRLSMPRASMRRVVLVPPAPTAVVRMLGRAESVRE